MALVASFYFLDTLEAPFYALETLQVCFKCVKKVKRSTKEPQAQLCFPDGMRALSASPPSPVPKMPVCGEGQSRRGGVGFAAFRRWTLYVPVRCGVHSGGYHRTGSVASHSIEV